jgi:hypothetical protein
MSRAGKDGQQLDNAFSKCPRRHTPPACPIDTCLQETSCVLLIRKDLWIYVSSYRKLGTYSCCFYAPTNGDKLSVGRLLAQVQIENSVRPSHTLSHSQPLAAPVMSLSQDTRCC